MRIIDHVKRWAKNEHFDNPDSWETGYNSALDDLAQEIARLEALPFSKYNEFLGKKVKIVLAYDLKPTGPNGLLDYDRTKPTVVHGTLLSYGQGGDFVIQEDDGMLQFCWPLLEVELADE